MGPPPRPVTSCEGRPHPRSSSATEAEHLTCSLLALLASLMRDIRLSLVYSRAAKRTSSMLSGNLGRPLTFPDLPLTNGIDLALFAACFSVWPHVICIKP